LTACPWDRLGRRWLQFRSLVLFARLCFAGAAKTLVHISHLDDQLEAAFESSGLAVNRSRFAMIRFMRVLE
jgi:hypothetical protein